MEENSVFALNDCRAESKAQCHNTLAQNTIWINPLKRLCANLVNAAIVVLSIKDPRGKRLARELEPWRDHSKMLFRTILAAGHTIVEVLHNFDQDAEKKLKELNGKGIVVIDHGVAEVFEI